MNVAMRRIAERARANLNRNFVYYLIVFFVFVVGAMSGGYSGAGLPGGARQALSRYIEGVFDASAGAFSVSSILFQSLFAHVLFLTLIALSGVGAALIPVSLIALMFRGFLFGFAAAALVTLAGLKGTLTMLLCVVFPGLVIAPCYLYVAAEGMRSGVEGLKTRGQNGARIREHISRTASAFFVALVGVALETMLVPLWLKLAAGLL